ncbi:MAG: orotidine-5'-phosphate decarboxylase [Acidobacteriia bacterium]|mgnify:FL=1|nr:orotidine-5'-phosphate decarboxylase [Terriglobia bacterium]
MEAAAYSRLIVALDFPAPAPAVALARRLVGRVGMVKVGSELFTAAGPGVVQRLADLGLQIFLDLKFHDIPTTVAGAVAAAVRLPGVRLLNVHALGGLAMMRAARAALTRGRRRPRLVAVTVLTSHDAASLRRCGIAGPPQSRAVALARLAQRAGLDGVVCSAQELPLIRKVCGKTFLTVVPGIRPAGAARADQQRIATPAVAIRAGADYLVVGRPITRARDPLAATEAIVAEMQAALAVRV